MTLFMRQMCLSRTEVQSKPFLYKLQYVLLLMFLKNEKDYTIFEA